MAEPTASGQVSLVGALSLSPSPTVGSPVTATFTVKNTGGSPVAIAYLLAAARTSAGANVDFPPSAPVSLQPGEQQVYAQTETFGVAGDYTAWPSWYDGTNYYQLAPATAFAVTAAPGQVSLVGALSLSPSPTVGSPVTATFTVKNTGGSPVAIAYLLAAARTSAGANVDFPPSAPVSLQPGEQQVYAQTETFGVAGDYTAWPSWYDGTNYYQLAPATAFAVSSPAAGPVVVVGPNDKVSPTASISGPASATLIGGGNEFLSFQIVVSAGTAALTGMTASCPGSLTGTAGSIAATNVSLYRSAYYTVNPGELSGPDSLGAGPWPDPLIPVVDPFYGEQRGAFPIDVPAGENRVIWVDVFVPAATPSGDYQGAVQVSTNDWTIDVPFDLHVIPFTLPATATLRSSFFVNSGTLATTLNGGANCWAAAAAEDLCWEINELFLAIGLDHRTTLANAWLETPTAGKEPFFESHLEPYLDGTGGKTTLPSAQMTTLEFDPNNLATWLSLVNPLGTGAEPFVYLSTVCDELYLGSGPAGLTCPPGWSSSCWPALEGIFTEWPLARVQMTMDIQTSDQCGIAPSINGAGGLVLLIPVINYMDGKADDPQHAGDQHDKYAQFVAAKAGNEVWLYSSCNSYGCGPGSSTSPDDSGWPSYAIDVTGSQNRAMSWLCFIYQATGELYYEADHNLQPAWNPGGQWYKGGNGDGTLFYPGIAGLGDGFGPPLQGSSPIPIASVRLKLIRAGRQDYEYLHYLANNGQSGQALQIAQQLFPNAYSTICTNEQVENAHQQLASAVEALISAGGAAARESDA